MKSRGKKARGKAIEPVSAGNLPKTSSQLPNSISPPPSPAQPSTSPDLIEDLPPLPPSVPSTPTPSSSIPSPSPTTKESAPTKQPSDSAPGEPVAQPGSPSSLTEDSKAGKDPPEAAVATSETSAPKVPAEQLAVAPSNEIAPNSNTAIAERSAVPEQESALISAEALPALQKEADPATTEEPIPRAPSPPPSTALRPPLRKQSTVYTPPEGFESVNERPANFQPHRSSLSRAPYTHSLASQPLFQQPFASRVPSEHYSTPPHPTPNYQPRYFSHTPPSAPPYYHTMSPPNGYANNAPYPLQSQNPTPPYNAHYGSFSPPFDPFSNNPPVLRHDSVASRGSNHLEYYPNSAPDNSSAIEDDAADLFSRISSAIPDLHLLLTRYKETHGQLGLREELTRRAEMQQLETIKRKDDHIDHLTKELEAEKKERDSEKTKHRLEIGNQDENLRECRDRIALLEKGRVDLENAKAALEADRAALDTLKVEIEEKMKADFETWKVEAHDPCKAENIALAVQFDKTLKEQEVAGEAKLAEAEESFAKQKNGILTEFETQKREIESEFEKVRKDIESQLIAIQKDLEDALQKERESREAWHTEREKLIEAHDLDIQTRQKQWDEQSEALVSQHQKDKDSSEKAWIDLHADATKKTDEERSKAEQLSKEKEELQKSLDEEKEQAVKEMEAFHQRMDEEKETFSKDMDNLHQLLQAERAQFTDEKVEHQNTISVLEGRLKEIGDIQAVLDAERTEFANYKAEREKLIEELQLRIQAAEVIQKQLADEKTAHEQDLDVIRSVATNLETEKSRLEKLTEAYGGISDIKSKGDAFYLDSFGQLSKQVLDLAKSHFAHLPVLPPPDVLSTIPPGLPSFLGDTEASRQLRTAYIAHTVSTIITFRVFTPFLFSLGRRYDKADGLFTSMSSHLRSKSTRKEAVWRQHTLVAAFTSSDAKQRINSAAGSVVEEVVNSIKHFTTSLEEEAIRIAVRRIVKLAAETWRYARLEREMITAKMLAVDDQSAEGSGGAVHGLWPAYTFDATTTSVMEDASVQGCQDPPKMLLRLFPVIQREAIHESFRLTDQEKEDQGCTYSPGLALYDDANPVVVREEELRQAGLPQGLSPKSPSSASDFPPPTIPPPRNPLPPVPRAEEERPPTPVVQEQTATTAPYRRILVPQHSRDTLVSEPQTMDEEHTKTSTASPWLPPVPSDIARNDDAPPQAAPPQEAQPQAVPPREAPPQEAQPQGAPPQEAPPQEAPSQEAPPQEALPADTTPQTAPSQNPPSPDSPGYPTPPRSRAGTPPSPLFPATDEIDGLKSHESRPPSLRRSSRPVSSRSASQDVPREGSGSRRGSGYTVSNRSSMDIPVGKNGFYRSDSRSAAIKGLYPNSPLAGSPPSERTAGAAGSIKSSKTESTRRISHGKGEEPTWKFEDEKS